MASTIDPTTVSFERSATRQGGFELKPLTNLVSEATLLLGLLLFVGGAAILVTGRAIDLDIAVIGALALLFVGVESSLKSKAKPPARWDNRH